MTNEKLDGIALATQIACDHIVKIAAERDTLKALCVELVAKHEKVVNWLDRYAAMHEKAAKDTRFESLADADKRAAANYRATAADIQPLLTRARSILK